MKYTVIWHETPLNDLTSIWMSASDRASVTVAAAQIDRVLGTAPHDHGESREGRTRVLLIPPLGVEYEIEEADRKVQVNAVWFIAR